MILRPREAVARVFRNRRRERKVHVCVCIPSECTTAVVVVFSGGGGVLPAFPG